LSNAIVTQNLTKVYDSGKVAVRNLSIDIKQGEVFGFLGPNGAGKRTVVKLLNGMLTPTDGSSMVFDIDPVTKPEALHRFSGVLTEHAHMYDHLTGFQNLVFYGSVFGIDKTESEKRAVSMLEQLDLMEAKDRKLSAYSTGMRQRLSLARAMIHKPKILFLDEPTSGLDPESILHVNSLIKNLAENEGTTIFLCTHQLRYAQEICGSYGLISDSVLLAIGDIDHLRSLVFSGMTVSIEADRFPDSKKHTKTNELCFESKELKNRPGVSHYEFDVESEDEIPVIVKYIVDNGGSVYHVSARRLSLEEIYFSLLEKNGAKEEVKIND